MLNLYLFYTLKELKEATSLGFNKLRQEHVEAWNDVSLISI
jgi:hypothetical protein